jgi:hypothetical protein
MRTASLKLPADSCCAAVIYKTPSGLMTSVKKEIEIFRVADRQRSKSKSRFVSDNFMSLAIIVSILFSRKNNIRFRLYFGSKSSIKLKSIAVFYHAVLIFWWWT